MQKNGCKVKRRQHGHNIALVSAMLVLCIMFAIGSQWVQEGQRRATKWTFLMSRDRFGFLQINDMAKETHRGFILTEKRLAESCARRAIDLDEGLATTGTFCASIFSDGNNVVVMLNDIASQTSLKDSLIRLDGSARFYTFDHNGKLIE